MSITLVAAMLAGAASAQTAPPPVVMVPRSGGPHAAPVPAAPQQQLGRWMMSPVLCGGAGASGLAAQQVMRAPDPQRFLGWSSFAPRRTVTVDFGIDPQGRPLSITRRVASDRMYVPDAQDLLPALATSRFSPGAARTGCTATFTAELMPLASAPVEDVMAYAVFSGTASLPRTVWNRLQPAGADCTDPVPGVLLRAFPAFKAMPDQPGYRTWSMSGYDIDRSGKPRNVRTVGGSGAAVLDRGARDAVARSRFERGVRTGCLYPYRKNATLLTAPVAPSEDAMRPADATCPRDHAWNRPPALVYPSSYSRRRIEGWAVVAYDVAPWGQTGNIRVLKAEPTAEFGDAATTMIRGASFGNGGKGYVGCVDRVLYVIRKPGVRTAPVDPDATGD